MARAESDDRSDETLTIDLEAVREKYRQERDKRSVGRTYQFARGDFSRYARDPYTERQEREPLTDEVDVAVVGAGIGGLLTGAHLRKETGLERIRLRSRRRWTAPCPTPRPPSPTASPTSGGAPARA